MPQNQRDRTFLSGLIEHEAVSLIMGHRPRCLMINETGRAGHLHDEADESFHVDDEEGPHPRCRSLRHNRGTTSRAPRT